ncbi:MAG: hypothetical protein K0U98_14015 [Deltaproteobacteria bacterium]|nr:hypothetical protein [Deltaproteobacteria bacterium]
MKSIWTNSFAKATFAATSLLLLAVFAWAHFATADQGENRDPLVEIFEHYEGVRLVLLHDNTEGVTAHATQTKVAAQGLQKKFDVHGVEADSDQAAAILEQIPVVVAAAEALAGAEDVDTARDAFHALTKPLLEIRKAAPVESAMVAFCPMAGKSWLQPEGEIGNPYYGQSMAKCGAFVEE